MKLADGSMKNCIDVMSANQLFVMIATMMMDFAGRVMAKYIKIRQESPWDLSLINRLVDLCQKRGKALKSTVKEAK